MLFFSNHKSFLEKIISVYKSYGIAIIFVVINNQINTLENEEVIFIENNFSEKGKLFSLQLACREMSNFDFSFVQPIDSPFVNETLLENIWTNRDKANYITPTFQNKGGHPILISKTIVQHLQQEKNFNQTLKDYLSGFSRMKVETNNNACLININTPEDYELHFHNKL